MCKKSSVYRKAQYVIEFSVLITILVLSLLAIQNYLKRSMQGQIQLSADQLGDPYQYGSTNLNERFTSNVKTVDWALPAPVNRIRTKGSYTSTSERALQK